MNWEKVGMLNVNSKDPLFGTLEVMLEAMEEFKAKSKRTNDVLTRFDELEELNIPAGASMALYLRSGVPLRLVIDSTVKSPELEVAMTLAA